MVTTPGQLPLSVRNPRMTRHEFKNDFVTLNYYKFGSGSKNMLCFHGYGMHGKQFAVLESTLGQQYTFWGFDLFFHKLTQLADESLTRVKSGLQKKELANLITEFCAQAGIGRFSVIGYSMGTHYATAVVEELPERVDEYVVAAPSSINAGRLVAFITHNPVGNYLLAKLMLSEKAVLHMLTLLQKTRVIDETARQILNKEFGTPRLRFAFYASCTYLRLLETDESRLIEVLNRYPIKSIFIFGRRDKMYLPAIGKKFFAKFRPYAVLELDENHEMINANFAAALAQLL